MVYSRIFTKINNFIFKKTLSQKISIFSNLVIFCSDGMSVFFSKDNPRLYYIQNYYYYIFNKRKFFENKLLIIYKKLFFYNFDFHRRLNTQNRKLNIIIVGNLNNLLLPFALRLRKFGHNVQLILTSSESLHRPESIYKEWNNNLPKWIVDYGQKDIKDYLKSSNFFKKKLQKLSIENDLFVLTNMNICLSAYIDIPHVAVLLGSDLYQYTNFDFYKEILKKHDKCWINEKKGSDYINHLHDMISRQITGIKSSILYSFNIKNLLPAGEKILENLDLTNERFDFYFGDNPITKNNLEVKQKKSKFSILNGSRINFSNNNKFNLMDQKGTEILIDAFYKFLKLGGKGNLILFEKGNDLDEAKKLINNYKINNNVIWFKEKKLYDFYLEVLRADIVVDNLVDNVPGRVTLDAMAMSKAVVCKINQNPFIQNYNKKLPIIDFENSTDLSKVFLKLSLNKKTLDKNSKQSFNFFKAHLSPDIQTNHFVKKLEITIDKLNTKI